MDSTKTKERLAGFLILAGMLAGIFSVTPAVDGTNYLREASANPNQVVIAAICQFVMALAYAGFAILLYPVIKSYGKSLSVGFLSMRVIAATLAIIGTLMLPSILVLSQSFVANASPDLVMFETLGNLLKSMRDHINHVFMILSLCAGNSMFYLLLLRSGLIPRWLSLPGLLGNVLSGIASVLVLCQEMEIITSEYLLLNALTALQELVLAVWLLIKGFDKRLLNAAGG